MISSAEALARILDDVPQTGLERVPLLGALGRVLAEPLLSGQPLPAFDYSAMDGYAVAAAGLGEDGPWILPIVGESRTGGELPPLVRGTACRIFTGAGLPPGADCVVMQENVEREGDTIVLEERPKAGENVRRAGEDLAAGAVALAAGTRLGPGQLGLAAALDRSEITVRARPRVSIICTGDELRVAGEAPRPGSIPESNGPALAALVTLAGGAPVLLPFARDDLEATAASLKAALAASELVLTVGGVSVGDHDVVKPALAAAGASVEFWKVRIRPGKPLLHGRAGRTRVLGLPGNPVSAQVTFALFGAPLVRRMQGDVNATPPRRHAKLASELSQRPGRESFLRGVLEGNRVTLLPNQASGAPTSMAWANCLVVVPETTEVLPQGSEVEVIALVDV